MEKSADELLVKLGGIGVAKDLPTDLSSDQDYFQSSGAS